MKFLVPTDFSGNAFHAALYANMLVNEKPGSSIHLLHVLTPIVSDPVVIGDVEEQALKLLQKLKADLQRRSPQCLISHSLKIGETVQEINRTAKELGSGIIVMGVRGVGDISRAVFGSNTYSLIRTAVCPVLAIPETTVFSVPKKVVFATDYYDSDVEALERLIPIAAAFESEITVVHIFDEQDEEPSESIMMNLMSNEIFKSIQYPRLTYRVYYHENPSLGLKGFSESMDADLVVLSARKQNVFQKMFRNSVTKDLTYHSAIPLLIFHVHTAEDPDFS